MSTQIPLTSGGFALVDDEDVALVSQYRWARNRKYAAHCYQANGHAHTLYMHRLLMNPPPGLEVDHENADGLDNRRANLRIVTRGQNNQNRRGVHPMSQTGVRNVHWRASRGRYEVQFWVNGRSYQKGGFRTLDEAASAAREMRLRYMTHNAEDR